MPNVRLYLASLLLTLVAISGAVQADAPRLRMEGSTTLLPAIQRLAGEYRNEHAPLVTEIHGGGSASGIDALIAGKAEIASSSRFLTQDELQRATAQGVYPVPFRVAYDAVIPIVHKSNGIDDLSLEQLKMIFSGRLTNWSSLGGPDHDIRIVIRDPGSGTRSIWNQFVTPAAAEVAGAVKALSGSDVVRLVADHRGAIGYIGLANLNANVRPLSVDGIMGSVRNIRSGAYRLSRPLFFFTNGWPPGATLEFIDYVLDPDRGQRVIAGTGLVPLYELSRR